MFNRKRILAALVAGATVLSACSAAEERGSNAYAVTAPVADASARMELSFEVLQNTATGDMYSWSSELREEVDHTVLFRYNEYSEAIVAPGGYTIGETEESYYICVSSGKQPVGEGFVIEGIMLETMNFKDSLLKIEAAPINAEANSSIDTEKNYTALVRILKSELPPGAVINGVSLTGGI